MKRFLTALSLVGAMGGVAWGASTDDVLMVGKLSGSGVTPDEAGTIETSICTAAQQDKRFLVRCRDVNAAVMQLRQQQAELGFGENEKFFDDCGPQGCLGNLSKGVQAKWVLGGSLAKVAEKQYLLTLLVADPVSGQQLNRVEEKVSGEMSSVVDRVPEAVRKVLTPPSQPAKQPAPAAAPAKK